MKIEIYDTESFNRSIEEQKNYDVSDKVIGFANDSLNKISLDPNFQAVLQNSNFEQAIDDLTLEVTNAPGNTEPRVLYRPFSESLHVNTYEIGGAFDPPTESLYPDIMHEITHLAENHIFSQSIYKAITDREINGNDVGYYYRKTRETVYPICRVLENKCEPYRAGITSLVDVNVIGTMFEELDNNQKLYHIGLREHDDVFYQLSLYIDLMNNWPSGATFGFGLYRTLEHDVHLLKEAKKRIMENGNEINGDQNENIGSD